MRTRSRVWFRRRFWKVLFWGTMLVFTSLAGGLWFASNWSGTKTNEQLLAGGNLVIRGGALSARSTSQTAVLSTTVSPVGTPVLLAYPNPASEQANLRFQTVAPGRAQLQVYNGLGALVATVYDGVADAGRAYDLALPVQNLSEGLYFCRLVQNGQTQQVRLMVLH